MDGKSEANSVPLGTVRPVPAFDNPSAWPMWLLQYGDYSFATGLYIAAPEVQVRSMLYCVGPQLRYGKRTSMTWQQSRKRFWTASVTP